MFVHFLIIISVYFPSFETVVDLFSLVGRNNRMKIKEDMFCLLSVNFLFLAFLIFDHRQANRFVSGFFFFFFGN